MLHQARSQSSTHFFRWILLLRIATGLCLFVKGITFIDNTAQLDLLLSETSFGAQSPWLGLLITWIHLLGGFLILIGLLTRWAALAQLPILLGAIFFVNVPKGIFASESELVLSIVMFVLTVFFFMRGAGEFSLDDYFRRHPR